MIINPIPTVPPLPCLPLSRDRGKVRLSTGAVLCEPVRGGDNLTKYKTKE